MRGIARQQLQASMVSYPFINTETTRLASLFAAVDLQASFSNHYYKH